MKIGVLYERSGLIIAWLKILLLAKENFYEKNYYFSFIECGCEVPKKIKNKKYDMIMLAHHDGICLKAENERKEFLLEIKRYCDRLVWLDVTDSTGTCQFDVLPVVDLYLKKQLLKDFKFYENIHGGGYNASWRIYTEYYHETFGAESVETVQKYPLLDPQYADKLGISWNVGLGDLYHSDLFHRFQGRYKIRIPFALGYTGYNYTTPEENRDYDVHFLASSMPGANGFQREKLKKMLSERTDIKYPDPSVRLPSKEFYKAMQNAKMVLSPFGWGEICGRDFESFICGACLLKPSMDHLITYPNIYLSDQTYVSVNWDFSNFNTILDNVISCPQKYVEIARNGQDLYKEFLSKNGVRKFCLHLIKELNR